VSRLKSIRLHPFKSYEDATFLIEPLTVIIGRNASGKSNALDAFEILGRLARGVEVRDALDGRVDGMAPIRGGALGAPPVGSREHLFRFSLEIEDEDHGDIRLEVAIATDPQPRIVEERLVLQPRGQSKARVLIESIPQIDDYRWDIEAKIYSDRRGTNPRSTFGSSQLITYQATQRLEATSAARRLVISVSNVVLTALLGVFHLDPIPSAMRSYVPEKDVELRRDASNISAVLWQMKQTGGGEVNARIAQAVNALPEHPIAGLTFVRTALGDVMVVLDEAFNGKIEQIPARQMSDGMLRMLGITAAVLGGGDSLSIARAPSGAEQSPTILIEELENGLHPSQAANLLALLLDTDERDQLIITTHSPALLNALSGHLHKGVLVVSRDVDTGISSVDRLVDLPGYQRALATDTLGGLVESGKLADAYVQPVARSFDLAAILEGAAHA
jgi:predicted ATPase